MLLCDYCLVSSLASLLTRLPHLYAFWTSDPLRWGCYSLKTLDNEAPSYTVQCPTRMKILSSRIFITSILIKVGGWKRQAYESWIAACFLIGRFAVVFIVPCSYSGSRGRNVDSELWWHDYSVTNQQGCQSGK
jgi:hypothetical protein